MRRLAWLALLGAPLQAQTTGSIGGQVLDSGLRSAPGASISLRNEATGSARQTASDLAGRYVFASVAIGQYRITVEKEGFSTQVRPMIEVQVAEAVRVDFVLAPGAASERVEVRGGAERGDPSETSPGTAIAERPLTELPINGRDFARFSLLAAGALARSNFIADLTFNGLHAVHNQFTLDGIDAGRVDQPYLANGAERGARLLTGSLEATAEFRVQSDTYQAQWGRAASANINIATRSGANQRHGELFEFLRNNALDARNFFNSKGSAQAPFRFHNFGANVSGPLRRDSTFYFLNYEGSRQAIGVVASGTVPSAILRQRALSSSPALRPVLDTMPIGTARTSNDLVDLYTTTRELAVREDTGSARIDHRTGERNAAFARLNWNDSKVAGPAFASSPGAFGLLDRQAVPIRTINFVISDQHVFNARTLNDFLAGMQRWQSQDAEDSALPLTLVNGLTIQAGSRGRTFTANTSYQAGDTVSLAAGGHLLKAGAAIWNRRLVNRSLGSALISFASLDDFAMNRLSSVTVLTGNPGSAIWTWEAGAFVQDSWRLRPKFTLDYGLRYDFATPPFDPAGKARPFDLETGALAAPGAPFFHANRRNFAPRSGFAWNPRAALIVRGGIGMFYQSYPPGLGVPVEANTLPGNTSLLIQQAPGLSYPFQSFLGLGSQALPTAAGFDPTKPDAHSMHWNVAAAWQVAGANTIEAGYYGNVGRALRRNLNINYLDPALGRRPNPRFANINLETNTGRSSDHALRLSWMRQARGGVELMAHYVWAHAIDDVQDPALGPAAPQDNRNFAAERGNGAGDARHRLTWWALWELPSPSSGAARALAGGWQISSIALFRSGVANTVLIGTNTFGNGDFVNQRPDAVAGISPYAAPRGVEAWLNPGAFRLPARGTFGNLGRNTVFGPGLAQLDTAIHKTVHRGERGQVQFRAEIFNTLNHPNFDQPNTVFGTPAFGRIFNTLGRTLGLGTSRQIQLAIKAGF